jgi:hypothetical protein
LGPERLAQALRLNMCKGVEIMADESGAIAYVSICQDTLANKSTLAYVSHFLTTFLTFIT